MSHIGKANIKKLTDHNWRSLCLEVDHQLTSLGGKLRPGGDRHESGLNFETCFQNESNLRGSNPLPRSDERRFLVANFHQAFLDLEQKKKISQKCYFLHEKSRVGVGVHNLLKQRAKIEKALP